ncbi:hypothetical protein I4U23_000199 [Adineta vaga]|nr:hypothetical protein I4U23_000199 [Adineta vaga]
MDMAFIDEMYNIHTPTLLDLNNQEPSLDIDGLSIEDDDDVTVNDANVSPPTNFTNIIDSNDDTPVSSTYPTDSSDDDILKILHDIVLDIAACVPNLQEVSTSSTSTSSCSNHDQNICHTKKKQQVIKSTDIVEPPNFSNGSEDQMINLQITNTINVRVQPGPDQHVRYEKECIKTTRYTKATDGKPITIDLTQMIDHLNLCREHGCIPWVRTTRTTVDKSGVFLVHPYPIWMKNKKAKAHGGSLYTEITEDDISKGYIEMENLIIVTLKQDILERTDRFTIYDSSKVVFTDACFPCAITAKNMIEQYQLSQSVLHFQIMLSDANNILYPTNSCCETVTLTDYTAIFKI